MDVLVYRRLKCEIYNHTRIKKNYQHNILYVSLFFLAGIYLQLPQWHHQPYRVPSGSFGFMFSWVMPCYDDRKCQHNRATKLFKVSDVYRRVLHASMRVFPHFRIAAPMHRLVSLHIPYWKKSPTDKTMLIKTVCVDSSLHQSYA